MTVAMDGNMKIAFDGVGNGQRRGGGQMTVQCWRWVGTVQWTTAMAAAIVSNDSSGLSFILCGAVSPVLRRILCSAHLILIPTLIKMAVGMNIPKTCN